MDYEGLNNFIDLCCPTKITSIQVQGHRRDVYHGWARSPEARFQGVGHHFQGEVIGEYAPEDFIAVLFLLKGIVSRNLSSRIR